MSLSVGRLLITNLRSSSALTGKRGQYRYRIVQTYRSHIECKYLHQAFKSYMSTLS